MKPQVSGNLGESISVREVGFTNQPISYFLMVALPQG